MPVVRPGSGIRDSIRQAGFRVDFQGEPFSKGHGQVSVWRGTDAYRQPVVAKLAPNSEAGHEAVMNAMLPGDSMRLATARHVAPGPQNTVLVFDDAGTAASYDFWNSATRQPGKAVSLGAHILEGVAEMQDAGVIHRDLHPGNFLLQHDTPNTVRIIDFGHSVPVQGTGEAVAWAFSHGYTPPEMRLYPGEQVTLTPSSDLFVVGQLVGEFATGRHLFPDTDDRAELEAAFRRGPELFGLEHSHPDLARILTQAMRFSPQDRYPTARDFLSELWPVRMQLWNAGLG